jgi:hypothetical protein
MRKIRKRADMKEKKTMKMWYESGVQEGKYRKRKTQGVDIDHGEEEGGDSFRKDCGEGSGERATRIYAGNTGFQL